MYGCYSPHNISSPGSAWENEPLEWVGLYLLCHCFGLSTGFRYYVENHVHKNCNGKPWLSDDFFSLEKFSFFQSLQFWFYVVLLFIYISYTANIVALLQSTTKSIQTVSDLQNPEIGIGVEDTKYNRYYFQIATEPSRRKLFETKIEPPNGPNAYMNVSHGISLMRQGMFAFHINSDVAYDEIKRTFYEHEKCGLIQVKCFSVGDAYWTIQKHSQYKEMLKVKWVGLISVFISCSWIIPFHNILQYYESHWVRNSNQRKTSIWKSAPEMWFKWEKFRKCFHERSQTNLFHSRFWNVGFGYGVFLWKIH